MKCRDARSDGERPRYQAFRELPGIGCGQLVRCSAGSSAAFAVEGCTGWRFVVEELQRAGVEAHVAEPATLGGATVLYAGGCPAAHAAPGRIRAANRKRGRTAVIAA